MKINSVDFISSYSSFAAYIAAGHVAPEICMVGRSNVGKSTFINTLTGRKIAKTSSTPGHTRLINLFNVNNGEFTLVDLPGYGYAKASKTEKNSWQNLVNGYFESTKNLKQVFVLVDCRVESQLDLQMIEYLFYYQIPFTILASKCDKIKKSQLEQRIVKLASFFKVGKDNIIAISHNGQGKEKVLDKINSILYPESVM